MGAGVVACYELPWIGSRKKRVTVGGTDLAVVILHGARNLTLFYSSLAVLGDLADRTALSTHASSPHLQPCGRNLRLLYVMPFCSDCGEGMTDSARFCAGCGRALSAAREM